ncbi:aminotransferase [Mycolicibacterium litorale]|uniref:4-aminobutyrate aminotransferase n=1 Tax=Mycolicibacterium litorale TaxID=758802 RepID=A0AAD1IG12_9MYCO|nr:aminotransferase [Mycolicibacterium litorale]MCV7418708.1 aminotransferase [Mycolicibacterium litorale]TDY05894.1 4-aminobutyrate aminotransferase-like enzyme [Mycolicibacterium litorale]BBY14600.1 4-aminobutyrate aminotransferase [Mycolicibacterium litorale]
MTTRRRAAGFDFLEQPALPAPQVSEAQARTILATHYGIEGDAVSLGSQQDKNFLVHRTGTAGPVGVLKVANPAFTDVELAAQDVAAKLIADAEPELRIAVPLPNLDGREVTAVDGLLVRLLRYLPGGTLIDADHLGPAAVAGLGDVAARVSRALAGFEHEGLDRVLQWDLRYGADVVETLIGHVADPAQRERLLTATREAADRITRVADDLPRQAVHLDITDANVVVSPAADGTRRPDGVIDFGDLTDTWAVSELAIAASSVLGHTGTEPVSILPAVRAFHAIRPLTAAELDALWPMVVLRTAVLIVSGAQQAELDPDNAYVTEQSDGEWRMFEQATSVPVDVMTAAIRADLGLASAPAEVGAAAPMLTGVGVEGVVTLDLSPTSDAYDGAFTPGGWLPPDVEERFARRAVSDGAALVVTRFGEPRLALAPALSQRSGDVVPTGVRLWPAQPLTLAAPWDGEVVDGGAGTVTVRGAEYEVTVTGIRPVAGAAVRAGDPLAEAAAAQWAEVAVRPVGAAPVPPLVRPEMAPGWLAVARDPRPVLGLAPDIVAGPAADLVERRDRSFAPVQEHYYRRPPQIERGWRNYLMSTAGRCYLDMVNNVTVLGHAHPRVADTAARQLRRLNTNSRFNYAAVVEYSERLAAMLPDPLDTVFLVNSGSEASDLAIRLALAATGRRDVVAMREAYHGWTYGTDAVSTSTADNPNALATRPDWVHTVESPNSFRGKYRGPEVGRYAEEAVAQIRQLTGDGRAPAGFICESVYGNAGGMALPDGYLQQVYAAVRGAGGLAIADEVQVGYGRLGHWFWGFEQQGVVPDIVSVAKSTGNGYPLGAVITSRAVAEGFRSQGYFFSSTGGSPLSCAIGMTVLDVLREEDLQGNAVRVGGHLKARLEALADKHPIIGTVHGVGLYLGVEMVRDRETLEPAKSETAAICERMLDLGVIIQPTGDHSNILKTKPPLCIDTESADFYVDALDRVLTEGW